MVLNFFSILRQTQRLRTYFIETVLRRWSKRVSSVSTFIYLYCTGMQIKRVTFEGRSYLLRVPPYFSQLQSSFKYFLNSSIRMKSWTIWILIRTKPFIFPPPGVSQASIDRERKELLEQLTVVSKRVFRLILERQTSCTMQLQQIVAVQVRHVTWTLLASFPSVSVVDPDLLVSLDPYPDPGGQN